MNNNLFDIRITPTSVYLNGEKLKRKYSYSSRKKFIGKDYVVKVEWQEDRDGLWQCKKESRIWKNMSLKYRRFFVPTLAYGHMKEYDWVIQPRKNIKMLDAKRKREKFWDDFLSDISTKYDLNDLFPDLNCNWGFCDGEPLICDYGC